MSLFEEVRVLLDQAHATLAKLNRWPSGAPGGKGGQFAPSNTAGGGVSEPRMRSNAQAATPSAASRKPPTFSLISDTNTNAAAHNAKVKLIEAAHAAGDVNAILRQRYGTNTYGKRQVKLANAALEHLGSEHRVTAGQARDSHPGIGKPPATIAPKPPAPAPAAPTPQQPAIPATMQQRTGQYTTAVNIEDAARQLAQFGLRVHRSVSPVPQTMQTAAYGRLRPRGVNYTRQTDEDYLKVLNAIGPEAARLHAKFPGVLRGVNIEQRNPGPNKAGQYMYQTLRPAAGMISLHPRGASQLNPKSWRNMFGRPWTIDSASDRASYHASVFRHEVGHAIDYQTRTEVRNAMALLRLRDSRTGVELGILDWAKRNVSDYASSSRDECLAECFAKFTAPDYQTGTFPEELEVQMRKLTSRHSVTKAAAKAEDFVSITPVPPAEGYEVLQTEGDEPGNFTTLRFMSPEGAVLTMDDMIDLGLMNEYENNQQDDF